MPELLFEIGTEELPAGFIDPALAFLAKALDEALTDARLAHSVVVADGTPRRLALLVDHIEAKQADKEEEITGPSFGVAFTKGEDGKLVATQAGEGFLKKNGLTVEDTFEKEGKKGTVVAANRREQGRPAGEVLGAILSELMAKIPFKKTMSWGDAKATHRQVFGRPVQWILAVFDARPLAMTFADVTSGSTTRGHRYHAPGPVDVRSIAGYRRALERGQVVLSRATRRQMILEGAQALARRAGGALLPDDALLEIVKNLVEKPFPVLGVFEPRYLQMPKELLVSEMREHQKYFAVVDSAESGALLPAFIVVAGSDSGDKEALAAGNARVLRSRFEDGAFYFSTDLERSLASRIEDERKVVFHRELGSLWEKTARIAMLSQKLSALLGVDGAAPLRTAMLCKADLTSGVVNEFPELQGVMGRTYALRDGEQADVALGIDEHYSPRHAGASLPKTVEGAIVGVADRIDTIIGILAVGKAPTGSADPFALRRAAIAVMNILMDRGWRVSLPDLVVAGVAAYRAQQKLAKVDDAALMKQALEFLRGRVRAVLIERCEARGLAGTTDIVDAAMAARAGVDVLPDVEENAIALAELRAHDAPGFVSLCKTFKRVGNILKQARTDGALAVEGTVALQGVLAQPAEIALLHAVEDAALSAAAHGNGSSIEARRRVLTHAAALKPKVDRFFDDVMVMTDDVTLRAARLGLLAQIERVFVDVADFTKVQLEG